MDALDANADSIALPVVWPIDPNTPEPETVEQAAAILRRGGIVAFPTETVYGLGADALNPQAVRRIFAAKGRPGHNPLIVHIADSTMLDRVVCEWPAVAQRLSEQFWPGPLTMVLPRQHGVPDAVTAGGSTVAIRCPAHPVALALIRATGSPLAAPSANRSGEVSPTCAAHVVKSLGPRVDAVLDGGSTTAGIESTVVDLTTEPPTLLRPGPIPPALLESVLGSVQRPAGRYTKGREEILRSPGLLSRHYAPRTPLRCFEDPREMHQWVESQAASGKRIGLVTLGDLAGMTMPTIEIVPMPTDPAGYAQQLYAVLHELDSHGLDALALLLPPDSDAWLAVRDRCQRAAQPK